MKITVKIEGKAYEVQVGNLYERPIVARVEGEKFEVWPEGEEPFQAGVPAKKDPHTPLVNTNTSIGLSPDRVTSPIPGVIFLVKVQPGEWVKPGQELCVLEAMKMKNVIRSPRKGQIDAVMVDNGQKVSAGEVLVVFRD